MVGLAGCGRGEPGVPTLIRIGALPTEDALPVHVAALSNSKSPASVTETGFAQRLGLDLRVVPFATAQQRDAALMQGQIDGFVGDLADAAILADRGAPVKVVTILLGADPTEGRFGIVVPKRSSVTSPMRLRNVPIATSLGTLADYVADRLPALEGVPPREIRTVEVQQPSVRAALLLKGKLKAAVLPDPLLFYAQQRGARLVIDDTRGQNLSQAVLVMGTPFMRAHPGAAERLLRAVGDAARAIDADPERYRPLLVDTARIPAAIADSYRLNVYPEPQLPAKPDVDALLEWLTAKGLIGRTGVDYTSLTATRTP